jgi:hypothetical protein
MPDDAAPAVGRRPDPGFLGEILGLVAKTLAQPGRQPAGIGAIEIAQAGIGLRLLHTA